MMKITKMHSIILHLILATSLCHITTAKISWKIKPDPIQIVNENESIHLNCEFQETTPKPSNYFVIWYKDGISSNVVALNDKIANLNNSQYEIIGKYNLLIKNVTKKDSGLYTCQLFQSNDLIATVNLTVLVPPKYIELDIKSNRLDRSYYVENDPISLECCTNSDANPVPIFVWTKISRKTEKSVNLDQIIEHTMLSSDKSKICDYLKINLTRDDNDHYFKCSVTNRAIKGPINKNLFISVEYKPEVNLHLVEKPQIKNDLKIIENTSVSLFCNATGLPNNLKYQWFFNDIRLDDFTNQKILKLAKIKRHQAGTYTCRAANKHGVTGGSFQIEIVYAQISALNKTTSLAESHNLRQNNAIYINSVENSSITLNCRLDSNSRQHVTWHYYQLNKNDKIVNKIKLNDYMTTIVSGRYGIQKSMSQLKLNNIRDQNSGYYTCGIQFRLIDSLNNTKMVEQNSTYYLQVQYSPTVKPLKTNIYANNYDKIKLSCEVKSNPQSIISWHFKNKEIKQSYKYKIGKSLLKKFDHSYLDDIGNVHSFVSTLTVNSLTHFDYGQYTCRSNNIIGGTSKYIDLYQKQKPDTPESLQIISTSSNSIKLSWVGPEHTGENCTFLLNINKTFNLTMSDLNSEEKVKQVEIKGLKPETTYEFKILGYNSIGASKFTDLTYGKTLKPRLESNTLPILRLAQFNNIREAICFDITPRLENDLKGLIIKIDLSTVSNFFNFNVKNKTNDGKESSLNSKTYLISLNRLKLGQNCILFPQLIEIDRQREVLKKNPLHGNRIQESYDLLMLNQTHKSNIYTLKTEISNSENLYGGSSKLGKSFFEFKNMNQLNISLCYSNNTQVCTEKVTVNDYTSQFSMYITLIAVGCSAVLILVILLVASICCCYCCARKHEKTRDIVKTGGNSTLKKIDTQNMNIKTFPTLPGQEKLNFDYSDESTKSSQRNILRGSNEICSESSNSSNSGSQEKYCYTSSKNHHNKIIDMYDPNMVQSRYNNYSQNIQQNTSSIDTVESDVSSSGNGSKSSTNHSPYTVLNEGQSIYQTSSYYNNSKNLSVNSNNNPNPNKPNTTFLYNGTNYIKAYQTQTMTQQLKQMHHQFVNNSGGNMNHMESPESGYSTPNTVNNGNSGTIKKLVYEVIV